MNFKTIIAKTEKEKSDAFDIRNKVFGEEQKIDRKDDFDGLDDNAIHIISYDESTPVGCARMRYVNEKTAKLERVATLKEYRGSGVGTSVVKKAIDQAKKDGKERIVLDSQYDARRLYEKLGFKINGGLFEEVGIPHVKMVLNL